MLAAIVASGGAAPARGSIVALAMARLAMTGLAAAATIIAARLVPIIIVRSATMAAANTLAVVAITIVAALRPNIIAVAATITAALARRVTTIAATAAAVAIAKIIAGTAITVAVIALKECGSHFLQPSPQGRESFAALFVALVAKGYFTINRTGQVHWPSSWLLLRKNKRFVLGTQSSAVMNTVRSF